ncbi:MAG: hypothetical protein QOI76_3179 [Frankiales bacterium]|jgi:hypothetical protein|nr:hypothetical protein [Frankiales bacterium]
MKKLIVLGLAAVAVTGCSANSSAGSSGTTSAPTSSSTGSVPGPAVSSAPTASGAVPSAGATTPGGTGSGQPSKGGPTAAQTAVPAEQNPPGDIPDNLAFVAYTNPAGHYLFNHPEGWAQTTNGSSVTFTDKLNGVLVTVGTDTTAPTAAVAKQRDVPQLTSSQAAFELRSVQAVTEPGGAGVKIVYRRNSVPDQVTGRQYRDEVQRYELVGHGHSVVIELFGPVGADNVDAYRTMVQSLRIS